MLGFGEVDVPLAVDGDAVVGVGEILGGEPEVERVLGDVVERETGREPGAPVRRMSASDLPSVWMCPSGNCESPPPQ